MCGIVGFTWNDARLARKMAGIIAHRGPDDRGFYNDGNVSLGHQRLSIIDLSEKGRQPIFNEDGSVLVVFNGEIYNYRGLKAELEAKGHRFATGTDTEVLVHGYEEWGNGLPSRLNGIFAFCIYDSGKKQLFLARDHLGVKPLFYHDSGKSLIFASEIKAILEAGIERKVDTAALNEYLTFRYVPGPRTMFSSITKLLPGHSMTYDLKTSRKKLHQFWKLSITRESETRPDGECVQELLAQLRKSVEMQLMSDVPLGVFLSGGIDSASMVGLMHELGVQDIKTFSIGFEHYADRAGEMRHARLVADYFDTDHHEFIVGPEAMGCLPAVVWHMDEPVGVDTSVPTYLLSKFTKPCVTVTLSGEGGDEAFGGYVQYNTLNLGEKLLRPFPKIIRSGLIAPAVSLAPVKVLTRFFSYPGSIGTEGRERFVALVKDIDDRTRSYLDIVSIFSDRDKKSLFNEQLARIQQKHNIEGGVRKKYFASSLPLGDQIFLRENATFLPDFVLARLDRMTMAFGLESRVPLLDRDLVSLVGRIPRHLKKNKLVFRQAMKNILPEQVVWRKKSPFFFPLESWYSRGLRQMAARALSQNEEAVRKYFRYGAVRRLLEKPSSSMPHSRQLWSLLNFALWHKLYIEQNVKKSPESFDRLH